MMRTLLAAGLALALGAAESACATDVPSKPREGAQEPATIEGEAAIVLDQEKPSAEARVGDRIDVRLKAQFGTGFSWALLEVPPTLRKVGETMESANSDVEGGWEVQVFAFQAAAPGDARLEFGYRRPWETTKPPKQTAVFDITIVGE